MRGRVKNIPVAKSWEDLQHKCKLDLTGKLLPRLHKSAKTMFDTAMGYKEDGNEEMAYICFMKFCSIVGHVGERQGKAKVQDLLPNYRTALECAEILSHNLQKRYEEISKRKLPTDTPRILAPASKPKEVIQPDRENGDVLNGFAGCKFLECKQLFELLNSRGSVSGTPKSILIIDTRSSKDYEKSHIKSNFSMNIPDEIIEKGRVANHYGSRLRPEFKCLWEERKSVDVLVLMDWSSTSPDLIPGSPLQIFKEVIEKWDISAPKYKSSPHILNGGYERFVGMYPTQTTNSRISAPMNDMADSFDILNISFPNLSESPSDSSLYPTGSMATRIGNGGEPSAYFPSVNMQLPAFPPKPPSVDRSSKANAERHYERSMQDQRQLKIDIDQKEYMLDNVEDKLTHTKTKELLEERLKLQQECDELKKQHISKEEENERLRHLLEEYKQRERLTAARQVPKPRNAQMTITDESTPVPIEHGNDRLMPSDLNIDFKSNDDSSTTPAKAEELDMPSDMKRSQSTPNIAQVPPQDWQRPPTYDRSTKPVQKSLGSTHRVYGSNRGSALTGLKNLGNTCYMNSIIQCISNTWKLAEYFCYGRYRNDINTSKSNPTGGEVAEKVAYVIRELWSGDYRFIGCDYLKKVVGRHSEAFAGTSQQDSHEFLTFLMDWLHKDLCKSPGKKPVNHELLSGPKMAWNEFQRASGSFISELFFVQQVSTVECRKCREKSVTYEEPTSNLTLQLPSANNRISLQDCLELYTDGELISGYRCESCGQTNDAIKKVDIWRLPQILVIHLKRFYSDGFYHKRQTLVDFPLKDLDMSEFTSNTEATNTKYDLYAVSNHYGTLEGGHYTAYCRNNEKWYKFDDQDVSEIVPTYVKSANAYILFYEQVS